MRSLPLIIVYLILTTSAKAQIDRNFAGDWRLDATRSDIRYLPESPASFVRVEQTADAMTLFYGQATMVYTLDGKTEKSRVSDSDYSVMTKWEGTALLTSIIVNGSKSYSMNERWTRSSDGNTLTINRTVNTRNGESESTLVYRNPAAPVLTQREALIPRESVRQGNSGAGTFGAGSMNAGSSGNGMVDAPMDYVVPSGTRILLRLTNAVNTKRTAVGDHVYLQTAVPIFIDRRLVIPAGSYVNGTITESQRAGKVKGKAELNISFDNVTLPNGVVKDFHSRAGSVDARGSLDRSEGKIRGDSNKGGDARTIGQTGAVGAGIGGLAGISSGHSGMGAGIGGAAGALAGLAGVLGTRGPDVVLPVGTSMEMVLDRELVFHSDELRRNY